MSSAGPRRAAAIGALALGFSLAAVSPLAAQDVRLGLSAGAVQARLDGPATAPFDDRTGGAVGVFADVATPFRPFEIRVDGRLIRRGGNGRERGGAEQDLLSMPLAFGLRLPLGRVSLLPTVGLELAYPLQVRISDDLEAGFGNGSGIQGAGFVGLALDVDFGAALRLGAEVRRVRGLGAAFEGSSGRLEVRATEFVVRLSRRSARND